MNLRSIKNPSKECYEIKILCPELTFIGVTDQPDFAELEITYYPSDAIIELKSLKYYLFGFRDKLMSYERIINVIYDELVTVYHPDRLILTMKLKPRGGISSILKIDSDWRK